MHYCLILQDLPEVKEIVTAKVILPNSSIPPTETSAAVINRSTRTKRHAEPMPLTKPTTPSERKNKKRKSFEKYEFGVVSKFIYCYFTYILFCYVYNIVNFFRNLF